jgi:hypothetical protein
LHYNLNQSTNKIHNIFPNMKNLIIYIIILLFPLTGLMAQNCPDTVRLSFLHDLAGPDLTLTIKAKNFKDIIGMQFALHYDHEAYRLKFVTSPLPNFMDSNFKVDGKGTVRFLWYDGASSTGFSLDDDDALLTLKFTPMEIAANAFFEISQSNLPFEFINKESRLLCLKSDFLSLDATGSELKGRVIYDKNDNCNIESDEQGVEGWLVELTSGIRKYYRSTDRNGFYYFNLPKGIYSLRLIAKNEYWQICDDAISVNLIEDQQEVPAFVANYFLECPLIKTDISTPILKRCDDNMYHLIYENQGTTIAEDVKIKVSFDQYMSFVSTDFNDFTTGNQEIIFNIGNVEVQKKDTIILILNLECTGTQEGQTHCVTATAEPNTPCFTSPDFSGAELQLDAVCDEIDNKVKFTITNVGSAAMKNAKTYIVTEDDVMRPPKSIQLDQAASLSLEFPADGTTYRIIAEQDDLFPYKDLVTTLALEGCTSGNTFSKGFVGMYEESDRDIAIDKDCQQSIDVIESQEIVPFPIGYGDDHFVNKDANIEYLIRFANTDFDTVRQVTIRNTIPANLDINSLQMGSASHPYTYTFNKSRELVISFDQIALPDKSAGLASVGYVKYKILPIELIKDKDTIFNTSRIFYNKEISRLTNTTFHVVGTNFIRVTSIDENIHKMKVQIYPNPSSHQITVDATDSEISDAWISITDMYGKIWYAEQSKTPKHIINCQNWSPGVYVMQVKNIHNVTGIVKFVIRPE